MKIEDLISELEALKKGINKALHKFDKYEYDRWTSKWV